MKVIYEPNQKMYAVRIEESEVLTWINTSDIAEAREEFIKRMTRLFDDTVCKSLKDYM